MGDSDLENAQNQPDKVDRAKPYRCSRKLEPTLLGSNLSRLILANWANSHNKPNALRSLDFATRGLNFAAAVLLSIALGRTPLVVAVAIHKIFRKTVAFGQSPTSQRQPQDFRPPKTSAQGSGLPRLWLAEALACREIAMIPEKTLAAFKIKAISACRPSPRHGTSPPPPSNPIWAKPVGQTHLWLSTRHALRLGRLETFRSWIRLR